MAHIALRADGGSRRGFGHVRRLMTLADAMCRRGDSASLIVNREVGSSVPSAPGIDVSIVEEGEIETLAATLAYVARRRAGALVVDSYDVPPDALRRVTVPLAMILDAPPATIVPAALIISAALPPTPSWPLAPDTRALLGPAYALLREEFSAAKRPPIDKAVNRVLVTTGGGDVDGWSVRLARIAASELPQATIDVVVGPCFTPAAIEALECLGSTANVVLHRNPAEMTALMLSADVAMTGGGQTLFELAATGTPAVVIRLVDNQRHNIATLESLGALAYAGHAGESRLDERIAATLLALTRDSDRRHAISRAGRAAVDGRGADRVAESLSQLASVPCAHS